jgi:hypothetical protein
VTGQGIAARGFPRLPWLLRLPAKSSRWESSQPCNHFGNSQQWHHHLARQAPDTSNNCDVNDWIWDLRSNAGERTSYALMLCIHFQIWKSQLSRTYSSVVSLKYTDVSEVHTASVMSRSTLTKLHGAISQKAVVFIFALVTTWNLNILIYFLILIYFPFVPDLEHRALFRGFCNHRYKTHGRTPLDEWSARRSSSYIQG